MPIIQAAIDVNRRQRQVVIDKLQTALKGLRGRTVGILGLAFKAGTDDVREAPSVELTSMLLDRGAYVQVHDPVSLDAFARDYPGLEVRRCARPEDAARLADALVLATEWPEYRTLDWDAMAAAMRTRVVVDGRSYIDQEALEQAGLQVLRIGQ
jgi:UDPglucose 6-dehydrogenase